MVEQLKIHVPHTHREWVKPRKVWIVEAVYGNTAIGLLRQVFDDVAIDDQRNTYQAPPPNFQNKPATDPDCAVLYILPNAPRFVVDAVFKALAQKYHPDRLPDDERENGHERMVQINSAYERLRDRVAS